MPAGVPVAPMALNGAKNAGIFATQILSVENKEIADTLEKYKIELKLKVAKMAEDLNI